MKLVLSRSPIPAVVVIVALAAGTALVAGYVDRPAPGTAITADSKCVDCPKAGTDACCKVSGACEEGEGCEKCVTPCAEGTCEAKAAPGCCPEKVRPACGGGCPFAQQ